MSLKTKLAGGPVKHPWLIASRGETDHERDAREASAEQPAAGDTLDAVFTMPAPDANRPHVTVRRRRTVLLASSGPAERPVESENHTRAPRVFRVASQAAAVSPAASAEAPASEDARPSMTEAPGPASPRARRRHDRRPRTIRSGVAPSVPQSAEVDEPGLLSRQLALVNRTIELNSNADALRELQEHWRAGRLPLEERLASIRGRMEALREDGAGGAFVPSSSPASDLLERLDDLRTRLETVRRCADGMRTLATRFPKGSKEGR